MSVIGSGEIVEKEFKNAGMCGSDSHLEFLLLTLAFSWHAGGSAIVSMFSPMSGSVIGEYAPRSKR